jgi:hypothetical protein
MAGASSDQEPMMEHPEMPWTDEMLMAFADGELGPAEAGAIAAAAATDPTLAARIDMFRQTRARIAALRTDTAVPDPLVARIRALEAGATAAPAPVAPPAAPPADNVVAFAPRRPPAVWQLPLAASIALLAGLAVGAFLPRGGEGGPEVALLAVPGLEAALPTLMSGESGTLPDGSGITIIGSFDTDTGDFCREVEIDSPDGATIVAVACSEDTGWHTHLVIVADAGAEGYAPASSLDTLDAWLTATGASAPLSPEDEAARLATLD